MDLVMKPRFCLLFWFHNERQWSVQSSSTIAKPKRDPHEYTDGMLVMVKFQGKPYRAAIMKIADDRESLTEASKKLEKLLKDTSLSANMVMERMGLNVNIENMDSLKDQTASEEKNPPSSKSAVLDRSPAKAMVEKNTGTPQRKTPEVDRYSATNYLFEDTTLSSIQSRDHTISKLEKRMTDLEAEQKNLRKKVKKLEEKLEKKDCVTTTSSPVSAICAENNASTTDKVTGNIQMSKPSNTEIEEHELLKTVEHLSACTEKDINDIMRRVTMRVFSSQDLVNYSRTGKKTVKSGDAPKPALNADKLLVLEKAILKKCPQLSKETFIKKFENLQKMERRKAKSSN